MKKFLRKCILKNLRDIANKIKESDRNIDKEHLFGCACYLIDASFDASLMTFFSKKRLENYFYLISFPSLCETFSK